MDTTIACLQDIEDIAIKKLPKNALDYYRSGAEGMQTLQDNSTAFNRYALTKTIIM